MKRSMYAILCTLVAGGSLAACGASSSSATAQTPPPQVAAASHAPMVAASPDPRLRADLQHDLDAYLTARGSIEHISAASLSISRAGDPDNIDVTSGTFAYGGAGGPVTPASLFQIGSITKSFTAVAVLHLEQAGKLHVDDTVGKWLPQYAAWKNVTIRRLLDMTSGITTYDNTPAFQRAYAQNPTRDFTAPDLVAFVYPPGARPATFHPGWYYSNTAYILSQLISQKLSGMPFADVMNNNVISPQHLADTYYEAHMYPASVRARMVQGYFASNDPVNAGLNALHGRSVRDLSVSWAQGAGGIVATPEAVTHWVRDLFDGNVLRPKQQAEMFSTVSLRTGEPVRAASAVDPRTFGLGVSQSVKEPLGSFWFYEGETLGYRVMYVYLPKTKTIIAIGLNSQPNGDQDQIGKLTETVYETLLRHHAL